MKKRFTLIASLAIAAAFACSMALCGCGQKSIDKIDLGILGSFTTEELGLKYKVYEAEVNPEVENLVASYCNKADYSQATCGLKVYRISDTDDTAYQNAQAFASQHFGKYADDAVAEIDWPELGEEICAVCYVCEDKEDGGMDICIDYYMNENSNTIILSFWSNAREVTLGDSGLGIYMPEAATEYQPSEDQKALGMVVGYLFSNDNSLSDVYYFDYPNDSNNTLDEEMEYVRQNYKISNEEKLTIRGIDCYYYEFEEEEEGMTYYDYLFLENGRFTVLSYDVCDDEGNIITDSEISVIGSIDGLHRCDGAE